MRLIVLWILAGTSAGAVLGLDRHIWKTAHTRPLPQQTLARAGILVLWVLWGLFFVWMLT